MSAVFYSVRVMMKFWCPVLALFALFVTAPAVATAQEPLPDLSLEDLLRRDSGRVFGVSLRTQPSTDAPSSVSFVTAEDIERFGYRSLADILRGVRGFYVTDDRNFSFLGARGFYLRERGADGTPRRCRSSNCSPVPPLGWRFSR